MLNVFRTQRLTLATLIYMEIYHKGSPWPPTLYHLGLIYIYMEKTISLESGINSSVWHKSFFFHKQIISRGHWISGVMPGWQDQGPVQTRVSAESGIKFQFLFDYFCLPGWLLPWPCLAGCQSAETPKNKYASAQNAPKHLKIFMFRRRRRWNAQK